MADSKLSALSAAGAYDDADLLYIVQGGVSYKTTYGALKAAILLAKYPEVANFAALPAAASNTGETYVCLAAQGTYFINRKPSGFYYSDGASWTYVGELPENYFTDSILQISDDADPTKICKFQLSSITTGTTRTLTVPDASGTIVLLDATQTLTNKSIVASQLTGIIADARMPDLTGDVTTSEGAVATTIASGAVSLAKMANLAQDQFIGRTTASTGVPETATITAAARTVLDDATVAAMVDTLGGATSTGTGGIARATSPTFVTPALGIPASGTLTNCTGLPASSLTAGTLAANVTLGEDNGQIVLDAALSADGKYSGIIESGTAGAALAFGDLCYLAAADSRWELTDADAEATAGPVKLGMCVLAAAADGNATTMLLFGKIRADANFPALTIGAPAYVSTTPGDIQTTQPSGTDDVIRIVGYANTADELLFNPSQDYMTRV